MLARVPMGRLARADEVARADRLPRQRPHDVLDRRRLRPLGRQADVLMAAFAPRGWRLVRLGGGAEPRLGAIDPAAPSVVRELRERDPLAALRRGLARCAAEAVDEHMADDPATLAPLPLLAPLAPGRDLGGRRDLRAQPPRAHRGERVVGRRVCARVRRRAPRALPQGRRLPPHGRARRGGRRAQRVDLDGARARARARAGRRRLDHGGHGRQRPHGARHRGREPALPARRPSSSRPAARSARRCSSPTIRARPYAISIRIWNAEGTLVNEDATSTAAMHRSFEELASWCVRENPRARRHRCSSRARASCRPTTWRWRPATA